MFGRREYGPQERAGSGGKWADPRERDSLEGVLEMKNPLLGHRVFRSQN